MRSVWAVRVWRLLMSPGRLLTLATVVAVVALEWSPSGALLGLAGAVLGTLAGLIALQLGLLLGAVLFGVRVHRVVIGLGARVAEWNRPTRSVVLRAFPAFLAVAVGPDKAPVRPRMWTAGLCSALAGLAASALAAAWATTGGSAAGGWTAGLPGMAIGCGVAVLHALLPSRTVGAMSTGWMLFRLPRLTSRQVRQLEAAPVVGRAVDAANAGDLDTAERLAARLAEHYPDLRPALAARIAVLEAQARYAEAMVLAVKLASDADQEPHEAAVSFAVVANLACNTVETGQLEPELGLSTADTAIENAETLGYPSYKLNGARALVALLKGNLDKAISLARQAAGTGDDLIGRADDLATLARAHMAAGDNRTAREVLGEAERLVPWWPRVTATRSRLEVC